MSAIIAALIADWWPAILAVLGALGWGFMQRREGAAAQKQKEAERRLRARSEAAEIEEAIAGRTAEENRDRLKSRYGPK